jgi:sec-independent protein translocase protein TatB
MLGMSFTEIAIILVLALVLLGPDELPKVAKAVGKGLRELRRTTDDLKSTFEQEMVKLEDDRPAAPTLVPPTVTAAYEAGQGTSGALDQLKDPGAARAAARAAAADPGAARAAARFHAAGLPAATQPAADAAEPQVGSTDQWSTGSPPTESSPTGSPPTDLGSAQSAPSDSASAQSAASDSAPVPTEHSAAPEVQRPATPPDSIPREKKSGSTA